jgi:hypothetical protein
VGNLKFLFLSFGKKYLFLANLDFLPLPPNAQRTSTRRRGIAPVIAMSRLGHSSRPLHDPASRHRISFTFIWSSHCTSDGFFWVAEEKGGGQRFFSWRIFVTWRQKKKGWRI